MTHEHLPPDPLHPDATPETVNKPHPATLIRNVDKTTTPQFVELRTDAGRLLINLASARHAKASRTFAALAAEQYYDGLTLFRLVPGFVIQGGEPTTNAHPQAHVIDLLEDPVPMNEPFAFGDVGLVLPISEQGDILHGKLSPQFFVTLAERPTYQTQYHIGSSSKISSADFFSQLSKWMVVGNGSPSPRIRIDSVRVFSQDPSGTLLW